MASVTNIASPASPSIPIRKIKRVQFGIFPPEEVKANSAVRVEFPETYDPSTNLPKVGGLLDMRLGTNDRNFKCGTCNGSMSECPGHFGHLELVKPVFHVGFLGKAKKILECVCFFCAKLKADKVKMVMIHY